MSFKVVKNLKQVIVDLPQEMIDKLDLLAKEEDSSRSRLIRMAIRQAFDIKAHSSPSNPPLTPQFLPVSEIPNPPPPPPIISSLPSCEVRLCKALASGKYRISPPDTDPKEMYLCKFHLNIAKKEGEIVELPV